MDINFEHWLNLSDDEKSQIINKKWNPYKPEIDFNLKKEIVENFITQTSNQGLQYGISNFGWGAYMLFIIVENSKIKIPKIFAGIQVNKGVIKEKNNANEYLIKFDYGGKSLMKIETKIEIK